MIYLMTGHHSIEQDFVAFWGCYDEEEQEYHWCYALNENDSWNTLGRVKVGTTVLFNEALECGRIRIDKSQSFNSIEDAHNYLKLLLFIS